MWPDSRIWLFGIITTREAKTFTHEIHLSPEKGSRFGRELLIRKGNIPVLFAVPHDGYFFPEGAIKISSAPKDVAVQNIVLDLRTKLFELTGLKPGIVCQNVHRSVLDKPRRISFEQVVACSLSKIGGGQKFLFDMHGFTEQPKVGEFDLILGTGHRSTLGNTELDIEFANFMTRKGYQVYVPGESPVPGERYVAAHEDTLVQKMKKLKGVASMQIEISRRFRRRSSKRIGEKLSEDLAFFVLTLV